MSEIQGVPPPDAAPEPTLPPPDLTPPSPSPRSIPTIKTLTAWAPLYLRKTDATIAHLNRILSTPRGTDSLLSFLCYSSLLTSTVLSNLSTHQLHARARAVIEKALALPEGTTVVLDVTNLEIRRSGVLVAAKRLKALSALISDCRIFARLWGLLSLYRWGRGVLVRIHAKDDEGGERDGVGLGIEAAQVVVNLFYQFLENGAYLSGKGVLGWSGETQNKAWLWSSRFWASHVALDFIRLGREFVARRQLRKEMKEKVGTEKEWTRKWRREFAVNAAFAPLTLHWGIEGGLVGDFWVGVLGTVAGGLGFREMWRNTAES
ncbi:hypothetical protein BGZ60DRAFT_376817 [Tricladium varicosporioides]|nr:hypothetical protein BGZ60DRAFT_376817 [Hymenoscyphus varicosporioides]